MFSATSSYAAPIGAPPVKAVAAKGFPVRKLEEDQTLAVAFVAQRFAETAKINPNHIILPRVYVGTVGKDVKGIDAGSYLTACLENLDNVDLLLRAFNADGCVVIDNDTYWELHDLLATRSVGNFMAVSAAYVRFLRILFRIKWLGGA